MKMLSMTLPLGGTLKSMEWRKYEGKQFLDHQSPSKMPFDELCG